MNKDKISIVTVTYNAEKYIEKTIKSIISQNYPNKELIIIDGESIDSTLEIVAKYKTHIDICISEPDNGIFDAMNKGIKLATGNWLIFMNAGDLFYNNEVINVIDFPIFSEFCLLYGNTLDIGSVIRKPYETKILKYGIIFACHQSMFFNKKLLKNNLYFTDKYKYYNDYYLVVNIFKNFKIQYIDINISCYLGGGYSSKTNWFARRDKYLMLYKIYGIKGILRGLLYKLLKSVGHE